MDKLIGIVKYFKESLTEILNKMCTRNKGDLSNMDNVAICRICYQSDGALIEPCSCKGTIAFMHNHCLEEWLEVKNGSLCCELCASKFKINLNQYFKIKFRTLFDNDWFLVCSFCIVFDLCFFYFVSRCATN